MESCLKELKALHDFYKTGKYSKMGIAIALGVNRRTVRRWFQSKNPPTETHQKAIKALVRNLKSTVTEED